ncbi:hypothetical protein EGH82_10250 [Vibrio ponticus]|uniref:WYL domain-containing protein n=1 Tax=Vibrio ponticus TaxID=265668 RepID=A0A3N3E0I6_9VIBR|nr:hypothetical protein [Vibrio ponticus]ROV60176.1 hypothetical protein EGH82_10250 [Vibrio ponticus]
MEFVVISIVAIIVIYAFAKRATKKAMSDPAQFQKYVQEQGYDIEEQKDFCERIGIDYEKVSKNITSQDVNSHTSKTTFKPNLDHSNELLTSRREKALYKLALQILEDDVVDIEESKKLRAWFRKYPESKIDDRTKELANTAELYLEDKILDHDEALHLFLLLTDYCDGVEAREKDKPSRKISASKPSKKINIESNSGFSYLNDLSLGNEYFMNYRDSSGKVSDRNIVLRQIDQNSQGDIYIKGYCLMRNAVRTFRADRITGLCCVETGEAFV